MAAEVAKGSMPAPVAASAAADVRPSETPKDLKKRVRGLDKSLTSVHERLVQTEKQIFDLERSYLEETRLYGNVLQGWDAYLDTKGKVEGGAAGGGAGARATKREASEDGNEGEGGLNKRTKGVELEERLFSLGSVTSPAAKGLQKLEDARRRAGSKSAGSGGSGGGGGGGGGSAGGGGSSAGPKTPKRLNVKRGASSSKKESTSKKKKR